MKKRRLAESKNKQSLALYNKSISELKALLSEKKAELTKLKLELSLKKIKNVHAKILKRRDIARIKTLIREKELMEAK